MSLNESSFRSTTRATLTTTLKTTPADVDNNGSERFEPIVNVATLTAPTAVTVVIFGIRLWSLNILPTIATVASYPKWYRDKSVFFFE